MGVDPLKRVVEGNLCAGCGACTQIAQGTSMAMQGGYLRPKLDRALTPSEAVVFEDVCPGASMVQRPDGREDHPLWGPLIKVRAGHSTDKDVRYNGSSGGGLSGLAIHLLEEGAIDGVIQIAGAELPAYANKTVISRNKTEIIDAAGSRYNPSAPLEGLDELLDGSERFAFVGKPCDVAALRALSRHDARIDERIPYMMSFFCAGVPSEEGAQEVVKALGVELDDLSSFRYRGEGWPGYAKATRKDGSTEKMSYEDSWGSILSSHVQFRCKICPDGTGGFADIVCADAWETDARGYPVFEEGDGTSLIVSRTEKGEAVVQGAMAAGRIDTHDFAAEKIAPMQPGQLGKRHYGFARLAALAVLRKPYPRYEGFHLRYGARAAPIKYVLKNFLGTLRRVWRGSY